MCDAESGFHFPGEPGDSFRCFREDERDVQGGNSENLRRQICSRTETSYREVVASEIDASLQTFLKMNYPMGHLFKDGGLRAQVVGFSAQRLEAMCLGVEAK